MAKSARQLETELQIEEKLKMERERCDKDYAIKMVEKIVFYTIGAIAIAFLGILIKLAFTPKVVELLQ